MAIELYREKRIHSSALVPFSYYETRMPDYYSNVPLHWHKEFELNYMCSGQGEFICGDDRFIFEKGDIIILQPDVLHAVQQTSDTLNVYDTLVFSADMLAGTRNDRSSLDFFQPLIDGLLVMDARISRSHSRYAELESCVRNIFVNAKKNTPLNDIFLRSGLLQFFAIVAESGGLHAVNRTKTNRSEKIRPSIQFIHEHFAESITIEQLAEVSHLSRSYFMSCFKNSAGIGAIEYLNQIRINAVCERLRADDGSISEIAYNCGFTNLANFNRQFHRQIGVSPKEYRKISTINTGNFPPT